MNGADICCCILTNVLGYLCLSTCFRSVHNIFTDNNNNEASTSLIEMNFESVIETYEKSTDDTEIIMCPITQEVILEGETVKKLPCGHKFSSDIIKWISMHNLCPICKEKVIDFI